MYHKAAAVREKGRKTRLWTFRSRFRRRNGNGKNPDGQGFKSGDFFAHFAEKYYSSLDGLDSRNGRLKTGIAFDGEVCYTYA